jgi:hypothetical protein
MPKTKSAWKLRRSNNFFPLGSDKIKSEESIQRYHNNKLKTSVILKMQK